ncbi:MAG: hypothetical protein ACT6FD_05350 [Methanosarcinaceae archaeon]
MLLGINTSSGLGLWQKHIRSRNLGHDLIFGISTLAKKYMIEEHSSCTTDLCSGRFNVDNGINTI